MSDPSTQSSTLPSRLTFSGRPPEWVPGIFYPLVVAALVGVLVALLGVREDVAVIKSRLGPNGLQPIRENLAALNTSVANNDRRIARIEAVPR